MTVQGGPVILIGIDAADVNVVETLVAAGELPNIAALRRGGAWGRLRNEPQGFLSLVWPSFFNGTRLDEHGWYYTGDRMN
jgi:predicted AlkP superfamily phosphohydrolase/phosphomutase